MIDAQTRVIDAAAAVSTFGAVTALVLKALPFIQITAGVIAIVAGSLAIYRHFRRP